MAALGAVHVPCVASLALLATELAALEGAGAGIRAARATRGAVALTARPVLLILTAIGLRLLCPWLEDYSRADGLGRRGISEGCGKPYFTVF